MNRTLTCILCPRGCAITVTGQGEALNISGNSCPNGEKYARSEVTNPVRTVTSTMAVANRPGVMVSVKTAAPVPKGSMAQVMEAIRGCSPRAPIALGAVLIPDLFGTQIVATKAVE